VYFLIGNEEIIILNWNREFLFEYLFNNTNIGELHFHGSIIRPGPSSMRRSFKGLVRSLTLHRHVDTIDSNIFPYFFFIVLETVIKEILSVRINKKRKRKRNRRQKKIKQRNTYTHAAQQKNKDQGNNNTWICIIEYIYFHIIFLYIHIIFNGS
jgi:hypothetical protein